MTVKKQHQRDHNQACGKLGFDAIDTKPHVIVERLNPEYIYFIGREGVVGFNWFSIFRLD